MKTALTVIAVVIIVLIVVTLLVRAVEPQFGFKISALGETQHR